MKRYLIFWGILAAAALSAASFPEKADWIKGIRKDHPRMIFHAGNLEALRQRANTVCKAEFEALKKTVDALPDQLDESYNENNVTILPDGKIKVKRASTYGYLILKENGALRANQAALLYLITGDETYARKARNYLLHAHKILKISEEYGQWADWQGNFRINFLLAYDWIYNALTPEERKEILMPMMDYLSKSRSSGAFKFRRSPGKATNGNYGEDSMLLFAGLAAYGDGIDDARAEEMLRFGVNLYAEMLDYREALSAGSGLLSSVTVTYSFGPYPYATFFFFHLWQSAFGEDISGRWLQMCDFPNWFDYAAIDVDEKGQFLYHGVGDIMHCTNRHSADTIYTHLAQVVHFYSQSHPEKMNGAYAVLQRLPEKVRKFSGIYPALPFALTNFDPEKVSQQKGKMAESPYFYNPGFGLLLMRSGKGKDDTFASFRFGGSRSEHQHYDELSFVIYKNGFLALDGGSRSNAAHHQYYAPQTVAHNSILIHQQEEPVPPFWRAWGVKPVTDPVYNHGGQNRFGGAKALALQSGKGFIYAAGDATGSYAAAKSKEVIRQFVYLKPDIFVIFDRVESQKADQHKEILFHAQQKPVELSPRSWRLDNGGALYLNTILPENAKIELDGGPGREFFASGRNWMPDGGDRWDKIYQLTGKWTMKVSHPDPAKLRNEYLHVLKAVSDPAKPNVQYQSVLTDETAKVTVTAEDGTVWELTFNRKGEAGLHLKQISADGKVLRDTAMPHSVEDQSKI